MSAWKPKFFAPTISSSCTIRRHECMPPQQISPSAASTSSASSATCTPRGTSRRSASGSPRGPSPTRWGWRPSRCGRREVAHAHLARSRIAMRQASTCVTNACARPRVHRAAAARRRPDRRDDRADHEVLRPHPVGQPLELVVARVDRHVRVEQEQVHPVELHAADVGGGGHVDHRRGRSAARSRGPCRRGRARRRCGAWGSCSCCSWVVPSIRELRKPSRRGEARRRVAGGRGGRALSVGPRDRRAVSPSFVCERGRDQAQRRQFRVPWGQAPAAFGHSSRACLDQPRRPRRIRSRLLHDLDLAVRSRRRRGGRDLVERGEDRAHGRSLLVVPVDAAEPTRPAPSSTNTDGCGSARADRPVARAVAVDGEAGGVGEDGEREAELLNERPRRGRRLWADRHDAGAARRTAASGPGAWRGTAGSTGTSARGRRRRRSMRRRPRAAEVELAAAVVGQVEVRRRRRRRGGGGGDVVDVVRAPAGGVGSIPVVLPVKTNTSTGATSASARVGRRRRDACRRCYWPPSSVLSIVMAALAWSTVWYWFAARPARTLSSAPRVGLQLARSAGAVPLRACRSRPSTSRPPFGA